MNAAIVETRRDVAAGWLGALLLHGLVLAVALTGWLRWQPTLPPQSGITLEASLVVAAPRQPPPSPPRAEPLEKPIEPAMPTPAPAPAPPQVLTTQVDRGEKPLPTVKPTPIDDQATRDKALKDAKAKADAKEREAALRASLAAEERGDALRNSAAAASWYDALRAHIERQWRRPATAQPGLRCVVLVDQVPGGEVVNARIADCNGDAAVRQSIEAAVFRASPLPQPPDPALFERRLELVFEPKD